METRVLLAVAVPPALPNFGRLVFGGLLLRTAMTSTAGALRACGLRLFGDRPNKAGELARNRGGDHGLQLPRMPELAIPTAQSFLGFPRYVADRLAQLLLTQKEIATDPRREPVAPASIRRRRAAPLPALVIPPWRRVLPLECSEGTRPR